MLLMVNRSLSEGLGGVYMDTKSRMCPFGMAGIRGLFLKVPEKLSHPGSDSKILIEPNDFRGSLHTRSVRHIHFSHFKYRWTKNGSMGLQRFWGFQETGPRISDQRSQCLKGTDESSLGKGSTVPLMLNCSQPLCLSTRTHTKKNWAKKQGWIM